MTDEFDGFISSNAIMSFFVPQDNVNFVYNYISRDSYIEKRSHLANGTGQKELSEKDFLDFNIKIPSKSEQQKIGRFFNQFDKVELAQQNKLNIYNNIKAILLRNMFV